MSKPGVKVSAHFSFTDYWFGVIFRRGHVYISPFPSFIIHIRKAA